MSITARDVAASAGVSLSTVSRALADSPRVATETKQRIRDLAARLGYRPNLAARSLMTGRHGAVGVVIPDLGNPFFAAVCQGIQRRAMPADHMVFTADTGEDAEAEKEILESLATRVDGIVLCSPRQDDARVQQMAARLPIVLVNRAIPAVPSVAFDDRAGMQALLRHLVALGHRVIAYAGGPADSWSNAAREGAFRDFAGSEGSADPELSVLGNFPPQFSGGVQAADIALSQGATAVVAYNDLVALGIVDRMRQRGIDVPGEVSVAGFDDIPAATIARPNLTTLRLPCVQAGRVGVDLLLDAIAARTQAGPGDTAAGLGDAPRRLLAEELMVRQSTAPAPAGP